MYLACLRWPRWWWLRRGCCLESERRQNTVAVLGVTWGLPSRVLAVRIQWLKRSCCLRSDGRTRLWCAWGDLKVVVVVEERLLPESGGRLRLSSAWGEESRTLASLWRELGLAGGVHVDISMVSTV